MAGTDLRERARIIRETATRFEPEARRTMLDIAADLEALADEEEERPPAAVEPKGLSTFG